MNIKPYTIIEILRSKGFDANEAEEIVEFIAESSQENILEAIKPLATREEVRNLISDAKEYIIDRLESRIDERSKETENKMNERFKESDSRIDKKFNETKSEILGKLKEMENKNEDRMKEMDNKNEKALQVLENKIDDKFEKSTTLSDSKVKTTVITTELRIIKWLIGISIATIGIIIAALKYFV